MNSFHFIFLVATMLWLTACEYDPSGTNFEELTPPEDYIPIEISLNNTNPADTIYLYQSTSISISIYSPKDLLEATVLLDGKEYARLMNNSFSFVLNPDQLEEGVYKLTVNAILTSGTGSLAEMMGLEGYMGELSWYICVIHKPQNRLETGYRINEEGFMEIYWENTVPDNLIEKYTIYSEITQSTITIHDATQKSFIDYGYVCGYFLYQVKTYLKNGDAFWKTLLISTPTPTLYVEDSGLDHLRIYWDKPFAHGRFNLIADGNTMASEINDTTITIPQIFGKHRKFTLEILPQKAEYDTPKNKFNTWTTFYQGTLLVLPNMPLYAYNSTDNIIYSTRYNSLVAFNATTLEETNAVSIVGNPWGLLYGGKIASAPHNSTVAAMTGEETWIFTDSRFINPIIISPLPGDINTRLSALTSNDRFFVAEQDSNNCKIFSSLTGEKISEFPFTYKTKYTFPDFVSVSENGQFFCASSENGIEIFEINGTIAHLLYTDTRHYKGAMFIPTQPDKLLLRVDSEIEIRQMPDFNIIQTLDVSADGASLCNIDPASMSLLYYQNDWLKVCKVDNLSETIFKIRSDEDKCKLFNNKLLTIGRGGLSLDITPYLSH